MKSKVFLVTLTCALLLMSFSFAKDKTDSGILTASMLEELKKSFKKNRATKIATNAVTNNKISDITLNRDLLSARDREFTHVIRREAVTDQKRSGRCWLFAGLNILRYRAEKKLGIKDFELSQNYSFFWHKLELANSFFENIIQTADKAHESP